VHPAGDEGLDALGLQLLGRGEQLGVGLRLGGDPRVGELLFVVVDDRDGLRVGR
jgi:hypothetical protein